MVQVLGKRPSVVSYRTKKVYNKGQVGRGRPAGSGQVLDRPTKDRDLEKVGKMN